MALHFNQPFGAAHMPTKQDIKLAKISSKYLAQFAGKDRSIEIVLDDTKDKSIKLPAMVFDILLYVLQQMAHGNAITITSIRAEMTTQEAADLLNVSRPFFIKLLDNKKIPFHKVGTHRKVHYQDIMQYKEQLYAARRKTLAELTAESQRLGLYD